jgi:hypothetical protein
MAKAPQPRSNHQSKNPTLAHGFYATRPIHIPTIRHLWQNIKPIKAHDPAVQIGPKNQEGRPAVNLATREFFRAMGLKHPDVPLQDIYAQIKATQASTSKSIDTATMESIDVWKRDDNVYVGANFDTSTAAQLKAEQEALLEIAADLGGGDLDEVLAFQPKALIAVIGKSALAGTVSEMVGAIEKHLSGEVSLQPVVLQSPAVRPPARAARFKPAASLDVQREAHRAVVRPEDVSVDVAAYDLAA